MLDGREPPRAHGPDRGPGRAPHLAALLGLLSAVPLTGCGSGSEPDQGVPRAPADGVVLDVDGLHVTATEIEEWVALLRRFDPTLGTDSTRRAVLSEYLLPLALSRREHAGRLEVLHENARALAEAAPSHAELVERSSTIRLATELRIFPIGTAPPLVDWAFDPSHFLQTSPPLPVPGGFVVVAVDGFEEGATRIAAAARLWHVPFVVFETSLERKEWLGEVRTKLAGKVRYVDPEYADALPEWL
jgi:hypothetical protein